MAGCGDRYYLGGLPEHLIFHKIDSLDNQIRAIKTALEEARPVERIQELERELGSYRRLEKQIRDTLVEQELAYVNLEQRAQQVRAQEEENKKERERLRKREGKRSGEEWRRVCRGLRARARSLRDSQEQSLAQERNATQQQISSLQKDREMLAAELVTRETEVVEGQRLVSGFRETVATFFEQLCKTGYSSPGLSPSSPEQVMAHIPAVTGAPTLAAPTLAPVTPVPTALPLANVTATSVARTLVTSSNLVATNAAPLASSTPTVVSTIASNTSGSSTGAIPSAPTSPFPAPPQSSSQAVSSTPLQHSVTTSGRITGRPSRATVRNSQGADPTEVFSRQRLQEIPKEGDPLDQTHSPPPRNDSGFSDYWSPSSSSMKNLPAPVTVSYLDTENNQVASPISSVSPLSLISQPSAPSPDMPKDYWQRQSNLPPASNPIYPMATASFNSYPVTSFAASSSVSPQWQLQQDYLTNPSPATLSPVYANRSPFPSSIHYQQTTCPLTPDVLGLPQHSQPPNHWAEC